MGFMAGNGLHCGLFDVSGGHLRLRLLAMHWYGHLTVVMGMSVGFYYKQLDEKKGVKFLNKLH